MSKIKSSAEVYNRYLKEYIINDDELAKLQETILGMLAFFHEICKENNIKYSIAYGTLLGAVRHGGFIPWDDDVDLIIAREDYNKLRSIINNKYSEQYTIIDNEVDKQYTLYFAKFLKNDTTLIEVQNENKNVGKIYIDLFILDNVPDKKVSKKIRRKAYLLFNRLSSLSADYKYPSKILIEKGKKSVELKKYYNKRRIMGFFASIFPARVWTRLAVKCSISKRSSATSLWTGIKLKEISAEDYNDTIYYNFDGIEVCGIRSFDKYLTKEYGDYMVIPPKEKQEKHIIIKLNCNKEN